MAENKNQSNILIEEIDLKEIFFTLLKKWYVFFITGVLCIAFAVYYILSTPSQYNTVGTILVQSEKSNNSLGALTGSMPFATDFLDMGNAVHDEIIILQSKNILKKMVEDLQLQTTVFYKKRLGGYYQLNKSEPFIITFPEHYKENLIGKLTIKVKKTKNAEWKIKFKHELGFTSTKFKAKINDLSQPLATPWGEFKFKENEQLIDPEYPNYTLKYITLPVKSRIDQYTDLLNISLSDKKANAINIAIEGDNVYLNEMIINKVIDLYELDKQQDQERITREMEFFIDKRINLLDEELQIIEKKVEEFRLNKNLANIEIQSRNAIEASRDYEKLITEVDMEYTLMTFIEEYIKKSDIFDLIPSNTGITDETLSNLIISYNYEVMEYLRLTRSTNENNPHISQLKEKILLSRSNILQTITNMKEGTMLRRNDIIRKNESVDSLINNVPTIEREYIAVTREQEVKRNLYLFLLQKREENQLTMSTNQHVGKIINHAYTPGISIAPRKSIILFIALCLTVLISLAYIFIEYTLKTKIENRKQLENLTQIPIISNISIPENYNFATTLDNNTINETFSILRNNLILNTKNNYQTILITSTNKDNARSIVATNLAISLSATKEKIALINFDTHESKLDKYLPSNNVLSISDYLNDLSIKEENIAHKCSENPFINIFTIGSSFDNLADLLINSRLNTLFEYLKQNYKYVIINSFPIDTNSNLIALNQFSDLTLFVCQQNTTEKTDIKQLNSLSETNKFNNISLIYSDKSK